MNIDEAVEEIHTLYSAAMAEYVRYPQKRGGISTGLNKKVRQIIINLIGAEIETRLNQWVIDPSICLPPIAEMIKALESEDA